MQPVIYTLKNGLRVIFIDTKAFPTLTTLLLVGAGSRYEHDTNNGVAHFFEHMAFKGSKKYPNSFTISSTIEELGGVFNAFTAKDHTGYWIKGLNEDFETVIDVLSDMVLHPLLEPEEIEREKGVIVEEINMYEDNPARKVGELFESVLYQGTPLGYDIAGTKRTVTSFTRETFTDYMRELYHPANAVLVVAGGFGRKFPHVIHTPPRSSATEVENKYAYYLGEVKKRFEGWGESKRKLLTDIHDNQTSPVISVKTKKTEQAHVCLGFRAFSYFDQRKYALSILSTVLGGGMSSRLFMEVRERRGLCYYISTGRELYSDVGNVVTQAGITNNIEKVKEAVRVTLAEHKKLAEGGITREEMTKAKESIKGRMFLSMEDSFNVASFYGNKKLLEEKVEAPEEIIKKIERVSKDEVVFLAEELFKPEKLTIAAIGPFEKDAITVKDLPL